MPKYKTETFGPGDLSWIGPDSSSKAGRTEWLDTADPLFIAKATNGVIPAGTPLARVGGQLKPYDAEGAGDAKVLVGFLYTDQPTNVGKLGVPVFDQGRIVTSKIPGGTFVAPAHESDRTQCVYL